MLFIHTVAHPTQIDWLHSPAARDTMTRLIVKYTRFVKIMALHPNQIAVPTLDVDLAWHTHQLSPSVYAAWTSGKTRQLIDHDDKIDESKLSTSFEWTSKTYQEMYNEVYSECTCWYCESIRAAHVSNVGSIFRVSKSDKSTLCLPPFLFSSISFHLAGTLLTLP